MTKDKEFYNALTVLALECQFLICRQKTEASPATSQFTKSVPPNPSARMALKGHTKQKIVHRVIPPLEMPLGIFSQLWVSSKE